MLEFDLSPEEADLFLQEAEELLLQLNEGLVQLETASGQPEVVQSIFRAAHTLKGSGGVIGHTKMAELLHSMETLLDRVRHGQMLVTPELIDVLLEGADAVRVLVGEVSSGQESGLDTTPLRATLSAFVDGKAAEPKEHQETWPPLPLTPEAEAEIALAQLNGMRAIEVRGRIERESFAPGARALQLLLALQQCGKVLACRPRLDELDDDWSEHQAQAVLLTDDVDSLTSLVASISELTVQLVPLEGSAEEVDEPGATVPAATPVARDAEEAPRDQEAVAAPAGGVQGGNGRAAPREATQVKWVRTSVERLDKLMNLVSELVTDRNRLMQVRGDLLQVYGEDEGLTELSDALAHVSTITDQLQDEVMRARMVPIEHVFSKLPRLVRDLARQLNKQVELVIEGQDTELDRTVIEEINDPLVHLVRNCVDHGVEAPEERTRAGKPERGRVRLSARSEESHIVILVEDDGAGIDVENIRASAVNKGVVDAETARNMSDREVIDLIFEPGFSTAKVVSGVSGRGVGMDVVRTNIERLNGSVSVQTEVGKGTRFELKLPLTLAIFPALMVEVSGNAYAIPLTSVVEASHVRSEDIHSVRGRETIITRGRVLPILRLDEFYRRNGHHGSGSQYVVEVRWVDTTLGLGVQRLLGRQEVVIKPLGRMIGEVPGISGGTIMGDGRVALVMDMPSLVKTARRERSGA